MCELVNVDIVMCIDASNSMAPVFDEVKNHVLMFHERLIEEMKWTGREVAELRVKVVAFRDYGCDAEPMVQSEFFRLPDQYEGFRSFVSGIRAEGGGDGPENALEAIALALKSDWTTSGLHGRHIVLVFTDGEALPLGLRASASAYPVGMPKDLAQLGTWWEKTDQSFVSTFEPSRGRLVVFAPNAEPWTEMQESWCRYWQAFSQAGKGLTEVDIQIVFDLLVGDF